MSVLTWVLISLSIWHFTVFLPDRFAGGIIGGFVAAGLGGVVGGFVLSGLSVPTPDETSAATVLLGIPGCLLALALLYLYGVRREERAGERAR